ncbi:MAG: hypothetical protein U0Q07_15555 [Acidimicrobiales bacterium]
MAARRGVGVVALALLAVGLVAACVVPPAAPTATISSVAVPTAGSVRLVSAATGDGAVWLLAQSSSYQTSSSLVTIDGAGTQTVQVVGPPLSQPRVVAKGPDGLPWVVFDDHVVRVGSTVTTVTTYPSVVSAQGMGAVAASSRADGSFWITTWGGLLLRVVGGTTTVFDAAVDRTILGSIKEGPDGALWFADPGAHRLARTDGTSVTSFVLPDGWYPGSIDWGTDGRLWFTASGAGCIGRLTTGGSLVSFPVEATVGGRPFALTNGPDGQLWFLSSGSGTTRPLARISTGGFIHVVGNVPNQPEVIAAGSAGTLWTVSRYFDVAGRIDVTNGVVDGGDGLLTTTTSALSSSVAPLRATSSSVAPPTTYVGPTPTCAAPASGLQLPVTVAPLRVAGSGS